jgi:hypothetical protein
MLYDQSTRGHRRVSAADACRLPFVALVVAVFLGALPGAPAGAVEMTSLYTVEVDVDPRDPNGQSNAYRTALTEVLIRVTGSTAAAESEAFASLFPNPARYVTQYRAGPDNTLVVSLDGNAIERILSQSGATIWGAERPLTVVWLAVDWGLGDREIVAADDPDRMPGDARSIDRNRMLRERVQTVASRRGLPIVFPLLDIEDLQKIGFIDIWGDFDDPLLEASARYEADSILVGRFRPDDPEPPRWTWYIGEQRFAWPGEPEEALDQLADALAARDAVRGDEEIERVTLTISGVNSVQAYGQLQQYLSGLRAIDNVAIRTVQADSITYEVRVRGGADRLDNILSTSRFLEAAPADFGFDRQPFDINEATSGPERRLQYRFLAAGAATSVPDDTTTDDGSGMLPDVDPET